MKKLIVLGLLALLVFSALHWINGQSVSSALTENTSIELKKKAEPYNYPIALVGLGSFIERKPINYCYAVQEISARDTCFQELAVNQNNLSYCNLISVASLRGECLARLS